MSEIQQLKQVTASVNFLAPMAEKPAYYISSPASADPRRTPRSEAHTVPIYDGRSIAPRLSLDREGFALVSHTSAVRDFYDAQEVEARYYPEIEDLLTRTLGAERVLVFDHTTRSANQERRQEKSAREPVTFAHNDYTPKSGPQRVRDLFKAEEVADILSRRFAVVNVWRPIGAPVRQFPLAVCDAQSIRPEDFVATDLVYPDRTGEIYSVTYSPKQRWFYFSDLAPDEVMLLKCYDSSEQGEARFTAHSAFEDPTSSPDAPPRESIEVRTFVVFPEQRG